MNTDMAALRWRILTWAARLLVFLVFLFWGAFFVEHTLEWFAAPRLRVPPASVWMRHGLHLLLLLGLLSSLRWPRPGAVVVIVSAAAFFIGVNGTTWPWFVGITCLPVILLVLSQGHLKQTQNN